MQDGKSRRTNEARSAETRSALLEVARRLFVDKGYAETSTPEIVKEASVTRGALYHHFRDKADLFRAVIVAEALGVAEAIERGSQASPNAAEALKAGASAYFQAMRAGGRARLLLIEGPAALGRKEIARIDAMAGGATLRRGLEAVLPSSVEAAATLGPLADILSAAFDRAALAIAEGKPSEGYEAAIALLLDRLTAEGGLGAAQLRLDRGRGRARV